MLVHHFLEHSAERFPDKSALICGDQRLTYSMIDIMSNRLASALVDMGLRRQDRVAIFLENSAEAVVAIFSVLKAGGIFLIPNPVVKSKKLSYLLNDSGARIVISHVKKSQGVREAALGSSEVRHIIWVGGSRVPASEIPQVANEHFWSDIVAAQKPLRKKLAPAIDVDLAAIIYTSGTTGEPKGVMSTHNNMTAVARSVNEYLKNTEEDIVLSTLPLSFGYGLYQVLAIFLVGGRIVLEPSFTFPYRILERLSQEKATGFPIVPTMAATLLQIKDIATFDLRSLRYITSAAAPLPASHIQRLMELWPHINFFSMYGLTECQRVTYMPPEELLRRPTSVGFPVPNCEVFIIDEQGREAGPGHVGELVVRGSNVMQGYWNSTRETAKRFRPGNYRSDAFLHTGDLFWRDEEGFLYFVARNDDLIKTRGERVSPKEIESVICEIPSVAQAAVIGVPDEIFGHAIKAFVVPDRTGHMNQRDILRYCKRHLEPFMVPKYIEIRGSLPKTINGKTDARALKLELITAA